MKCLKSIWRGDSPHNLDEMFCISSRLCVLELKPVARMKRSLFHPGSKILNLYPPGLATFDGCTVLAPSSSRALFEPGFGSVAK